jgi:hypothetical protein
MTRKKITRVMHDRFVNLVFKVTVPARAEVRTRPAIHLFEFFLGRANFDASIDTIGGKRSSTIDVPLIDDCLLHLGDSTDKVVKGLAVGFGSEDRESQVVILEVETDTRQVDERLDSNSTKLFGVT